MITERDFRLAARLSTVAVLIVLLASTAAAEWHEKVLYSFQGGTDVHSRRAAWCSIS